MFALMRMHICVLLNYILQLDKIISSLTALLAHVVTETSGTDLLRGDTTTTITLILKNKATCFFFFFCPSGKTALSGTRLQQRRLHGFSAKVCFPSSIFIPTSARLHSNSLRIPIPILSISSGTSNWDLFLEFGRTRERRKSVKNWWGGRKINTHPPRGKVLC